MSRTIKIKKGLDIPLAGKAAARIETLSARLAGIVPDDFPGHSWKTAVREGDPVAPGTPLLYDKQSGLIKIVAPAAGHVAAIRRGQRRKIEAIVIECGDSDAKASEYNLAMQPDAIRATLLESGLWALMRQRPYDIVPLPDSQPRDIYVTGFDSAPLAPELIDKADVEAVERGLEVLRCLSGRTPVVATRESNPFEFRNAENILMQGPHPAGNVGVQIAATRPVNKGETVWTMNIRTVARIGHLYENAAPDWKTVVAVTGPAVNAPHMVETLVGVSVAELLDGFTAPGCPGLRVISGNVLTGWRVSPSDGFLRFPYTQLTVIREGDDADEFMGWASLAPSRFSVKRSFPAFLRGLTRPFDFDARIKGGHRAMILSGEYDKVFPFDIYPEYLLKAIMAGDIDRMEKLGIYEVAPEDFALPEFVDTSKIELQDIVRKGLDKLRQEEE